MSGFDIFAIVLVLLVIVTLIAGVKTVSYTHLTLPTILRV